MSGLASAGGRAGPAGACGGAPLGAVGELGGLVALAALRQALLVVLGVRVDDPADEGVPHDVVARQAGEVDVVDARRARG